MNNIIEKLANADYKAYRCLQCGGDEPCIVFVDGGFPLDCMMGFKDSNHKDLAKWELLDDIKELRERIEDQEKELQELREK